MMYIKRACVIIDKKNRAATEIGRSILKFLVERDVDLVVYPPIYNDFSGVEFVDDIARMSGDVAITVGGDGTILRTFLYLQDKDMPVMGIGLGEKNFLSSVSKDGYLEGLDRLLSGKVYLRQEMRLELSLEGYDLNLPPVLNEVVFATASLGKTIYPIVNVEDEDGIIRIWEGKCDGVIVSTPVGSTAYSRSAGGSVVDNDLEAILITPLQPIRKIPPLVINPEKEVVIWASRRRHKPIIVLDGQIRVELNWEDVIRVRKSRHYANFIVLNRKVSVDRLVKSTK